jgi:hypothetical protein
LAKAIQPNAIASYWIGDAAIYRLDGYSKPILMR